MRDSRHRRHADCADTSPSRPLPRGCSRAVRLTSTVAEVPGRTVPASSPLCSAAPHPKQPLTLKGPHYHAFTDAHCVTAAVSHIDYRYHPRPARRAACPPTPTSPRIAFRARSDARTDPPPRRIPPVMRVGTTLQYERMGGCSMHHIHVAATGGGGWEAVYTPRARACARVDLLRRSVNPKNAGWREFSLTIPLWPVTVTGDPARGPLLCMAYSK